MRYSLKDLMLSVTLIAMGMCCLLLGWRAKQVPIVPAGFQLLFAILLPLAGVALISAGLGAFIQRKFVVACVATIVFSIFAAYADFWPWILNLL